MRRDETFADQMARIDALFADARAEFQEAAQRAATAFGSMGKSVDPVCDYSYLHESQCAHCLGHKLDPELEEVVEA